MSAPLSKQLFYHVSHNSNRESIESSGLRPNKWMETAKKGVYMMPDSPNTAYSRGEGDIYEVKPNKKTTIHNDEIDPGAVYSKKTIPPKDFKRIGHVFSGKNGEVIHYHKEEDCTGE